MQCFFDGFGTMLVSHIIAVLTGGLLGFRLGKRKSRVSQRQVAGNKAEQEQWNNIAESDSTSKDDIRNIKLSVSQSQKAGDNARQIQVGGIKNDG